MYTFIFSLLKILEPRFTPEMGCLSFYSDLGVPVRRTLEVVLMVPDGDRQTVTDRPCVG